MKTMRGKLILAVLATLLAAGSWRTRPGRGTRR